MADKKDSFPRREERVIYGGGDRKRPNRTEKKLRKPKKNRTGGMRKISPKNMLIGCGILALLIVFFLLVHKNGAEVFLDGESVGILEDKSVTGENITETLETQLAGIVGTEVKLNENITTEKIHIGNSRKSDVCTLEHLIPKLRNMVTYKVNAAIIMIDGGQAAALATETEANAVLDAIKEPYLPDEGVNATVEWVEDVKVESDFVDSAEILTQEEAVALLQSTTTVTGTYTVQTGDALYLIAKNYECSVEDILELNEGMTVETGIHVGEILNVPVEKPRISVRTIETQVLTTVEPKTYEYQYDNTQPSSYQKVVQQGRAGQKESTIQITRVNGFVEEEKEVSKEIITEPVTEIIVRGTL